MKIYPCAKVNLGLNIVERRTDGYHDLETVFYPIPLYDTLEVEAMTGNKASGECEFTMSGIEIEGTPTDNLVMKAYRLLAAEHALPPLSIHLHKAIPSQAGMGGGSSDAAYMIRLLNEKFRLELSVEEMQAKATRLGADCAFFIESIPAFARGIGDKLSAVEGNLSHMKGLYMAVVKTNVAVSTREAFAQIVPKKPERCCLEIVQQPVETWRHQLTNDFETSVFSIYPELARIKERLYSEGAIYAQMTGSGSAIYALFDKKPDSLSLIFRDAFCHIVAL